MGSGQNDETELSSTFPAPKTLPPPKGKVASLLPSLPTTSRDPGEEPTENFKTRCCRVFYDKKTGAFLGRTRKSWIQIISYSVMYLIFLCTFTLVFLYTSLQILKTLIDYKNLDTPERLTYSHGIGLTATPTSETNYPLIWYKNGEKDEYDKYVQALDKLLSSKRRKREVTNLGPCGESPYGYGKNPCVIVRINKRLNWVGQPLQFNSTVAKSAPAEVQEWMKTDRTKLWLQCSGYHSYDKEHIGSIKYYPHPPGFDANMFPLEKDKKSPLVAIQISEFTVGISLAVECKLWYEAGPSTIDFMLYVAPGDRTVYTAQSSDNI